MIMRYHIGRPINGLSEIGRLQNSGKRIFCIVQTIILFTFIRKNNLQERYGLCKSPVPVRRFLYYVPLFILATGNLWNGVAVNYSLSEAVCHIACMLCVRGINDVLCYRVIQGQPRGGQ